MTFPTFPTWPNMSVVFVSDEDYAIAEPAAEAIEAALGPEVPPPVWDERRIDPAACVAATKALCG